MNAQERALCEAATRLNLALGVLQFLTAIYIHYMQVSENRRVHVLAALYYSGLITANLLMITVASTNVGRSQT